VGAIADAFVAFAQPLIDQTDGSVEQLNRAMMLAQFCYNLGLMPEDQREEAIRQMQSSLQMDDVELENFRRYVMRPMMRRHETMFPHMHLRDQGVSQRGLKLQLDELDAAWDELPVAAIEELRNNREQAIPLLIQAIHLAIEQARKNGSPSGNAHMFAFFLLWEFKARQALPVIVEALSLPGELPFELFGDAVHDAGRAVACLADDSLAVIDRLVREPKHNEFVRWVMFGSLKYLVRDGKLPLPEAVSRLSGYLGLLLEERHSLLTGGVIDELTRLFPLGDEQGAVLQQIRDAFAEDPSSEEVIALEFVEEQSRRDETERFKNLEPTEVDTIQELQGWYSYSGTTDDAEESDPASEDEEHEPWNVAAAWQTPDNREEPALPSAGTIVRSEPRVGRNDPCPCGSGRKFKKCCGAHP
jgi:hypothetical protein